MPRDRKGISPRKSKTEDARKFFVIASEGADTERIYFEEIQNYYKTFVIKMVKVEFLERIGEDDRRKSSHLDVINQLNEFKRTYQIDKKNDEFWAVIDRDRQNNPIANIDKIAKLCKQKKYHLALSNPNFELWLLMHVLDFSNCSSDELADFFSVKKITKSKNSLEYKLSELLGGYDKSKYRVEILLPNISFAIKQAKLLDLNPTERWIENSLGTRVYRLMENIINSL